MTKKIRSRTRFLTIEKRSKLFASEQQGRVSDNTSDVYKNAVKELSRASEAYSRTNLSDYIDAQSKKTIRNQAEIPTTKQMFKKNQGTRQFS